jgi:hypothetical protein
VDAIASLFGMNLAHGLNEHIPLMFWLIFVAEAGARFCNDGMGAGQITQQRSTIQETVPRVDACSSTECIHQSEGNRQEAVSLLRRFRAAGWP